MKNKKNTEDKSPRVTGVGGVFFYTNNPEDTKKWYSKNLGFNTNDWGASFEFRNSNNPDEFNYLQWSPFKMDDKYFNPSKKDFMVNYRVQNIEGLVKKLKENGVTILDEIAVYEYGKFVHIMDDDGHKIELWEPIDSVFTKMDGNTIK